MVFGIVRSKSSLTRRERLGIAKAPGRPTTGRTPPAAWIDSLASLRKCITLCWKCARKFDTASHGYQGPVRIGTTLEATSRCDGCKEDYANCTVYLPIEDKRYS